jgi:predicted nucleotidyltransferase
MPEDFKAGFLKTLWILRDYLSVIVVGGGWVPLLYYHYLVADKSIEPIRTRDIDLLVDTYVPVLGGKSIDRLLLEAGFKPIFRSSDTPPIIHYEATIEGEDVEIEFLTD